METYWSIKRVIIDGESWFDSFILIEVNKSGIEMIDNFMQFLKAYFFYFIKSHNVIKWLLLKVNIKNIYGKLN